MKKRILAVVLALSMVLSFLPFSAFAADKTVTFELGANGSASHSDGTSKTSYSETVDGYTLNLTAKQQFYTGGRDAKGNSCVKLGSSKNVGGFTFTVPDDVTQVIIKVAGYKATSAKISVGDVSATISTLSNNGAYTDVVVSTATTKTLTFTTVSGGVRAMINSISYVIPASEGEEECEHDYTEEVTTAATCTTDGLKTYTCSLCGDSYTEVIKAEGHDMVAGEVIAPTVEANGYTIYTCSKCGATENRDYTDKLLPEGTTEIKFNLGTDVDSTTHKDASSETTYTETVGDYTLSITDGVKMYPGSNDATGKVGIKLGTGSEKGGFKFTVPAEVTSVVIAVAQYKANATTVKINGTEYVINTASDSGLYTDIEIDTTATKDIVFETVTYRAMVTSIAYRIEESECDHDYVEEVTTAPSCTEAGEKTFTCSLCGNSYTETIDAEGHNMVAGEVVAPTVDAEGYTVYTCSKCGATENRDFTEKLPPVGATEVVFEFGANGSATHTDGSAYSSSKSFDSVDGSYTITLESMSKVYGPAYDAKGNSCIKLGTGSAAASFTFTVPNDVEKVVIAVAKYKANTTKINVNGTAYTISTNSNDGAYTNIEVDTSLNKTIEFKTVSGGYRAMINSITYFVAASGSEGECSHTYEAEVTTEATCTTDGLTTYTCSKCGDVQTEVITALGHNYNSAEVVDSSYILYTCANCGGTKRVDIALTPIADILALSANTTEEFFVKGTITSLTNATYGNFYIEDENGDQILVYGLYDIMGATRYDKMTEKPAAGDTVIVRAPLTIYGTTYELANAKLISLEKAVVLDPIESTIEELSSMTEGSGAQEYIVEGFITSIKSTTYGNIYISDNNGNELYIYGLYDLDGNRYDALANKPVVGNSIRVQAPVSIYSGKPQLANAKLLAVIVHSFVEAERSNATCTEDGYVKYSCSDDGCTVSYTETLTKTGHNYDAVVTAPTCTEKGYTTHTCANCGDSYIDNPTDATGHNHVPNVVAPTQTNTGYTEHVCVNCGDTYLTDPTSSLSGVVQNVNATSNGDTVTITWDALSAVDKYIAYVYAMDGTLVKCAQKATNKVAFAGLEVGQYVTLVIAKTNDGWYDFLYADEVPFEITEAEKEEGPTASVGEINPNYVKITWEAVEGATKYTVRIVGNGETIYRAATTNSVCVYGLKAGTSYEVSVNAKVNGKYGVYGSYCTLTTPVNNNAVLSIQTLEPTAVVLTWDAVENGEKYFIRLDTEEGSKYYSTTFTSITISGLDVQKSYTVAINTRTAGKNYSGYGSSITFTTPDYEGVSINSQLKADGVHLSWASGLSFDKVWVKEILADGTELQHAALTGADKFTVDGYQEGTRQFFLILRVQTASGKKYVTTDPITVVAPAPKEVKVATEAELKAALAAAQVGEIVKITLTADITATLADDAAVLFSVPKATDVILNLDGHTINATLPDNATAKNESVFIVNQDATFAVEGNGTINATVGTNASAGSYIFNNSGATLLLVDGNYNLTLVEGKKGFIVAIVDSNSTLGETKTTILDGNYKTSDNIGNMFRNFANHKTESCSLIIEGGNFTSNFSSSSYPKAVFWNQSPNANCYGTGYINIVRGSFSGLEVENEHPAENVTISKKAFIGVYGTTTYVDDAAELKAALANGGYIVLNGDIDLSAEEGADITGNVITENTVLDLNGNTITYAAEYVSGMNGTQISAITVENGATLVIGNGSIDADSDYGIYAKNGNVVIVSGSYSAITSAVQVNVGKAEIKSGTFAGSETYLLNCIDSSYNNGNAQIVVTGGEFVGFDPANNAAEGTGTNFVAEGYGTTENNGVYIIGVIVNSGSDI